MFKTKWRIVRDSYCGYEVQYRKWWMPVYIMYKTNTYSDKESAIQALNKFKCNREVVYIDDDS